MSDVDVLRVVVRNGFSRDLASSFAADLAETVERLSGSSAGRGQTSEAVRTGFHH